MEKVKLFCLPYAGGSATIYNKQFQTLDPTIELAPTELAGRGKRFCEKLSCNLQEIIDDIIQTIKSDLEKNTPYVLLGYSMGSLLAYELYYKIKSLGYPSPLHIFFCARYAPSTPHPQRMMHTLNETEFIQELEKLNGTPKEVFECKDLLSIVLPIIRNDYAIIETYDYKERKDLIDCNISVLTGCKDNIKKEDVLNWAKFTSKHCEFVSYDGGHFFINDYSQEITDYINNTILTILNYRGY